MSFEHLEDRRLLAVAFSKAFDAATIGPGSVSTLTFTIDNSSEATPVDEAAFTDTLPAGVMIAEVPNITANFDGTFAAPAGGSTIMLTDGDVAAGGVGTFSVDVTSSTVGTHMNVTGPLTFANQGGDPPTASADLTVTTALPGFTKDFSPDPISLGERTTLTYIIDNTANGSDILSLSFIDNLPAGMLIAGPSNVTSDIGAPPISPTITAAPGSSQFSISYFGTASFPAIDAGATGTITVDVIGNAVGTLGNTTDDLTVDGTSAGKAAATLEVEAPADIHAVASFTDDPVSPGGEVNLQIKFTNFDRNFAASDIDFTVDLGAEIPGITAPDLPQSDVLGAGSNLSLSSGVLTLTGGSLAAGAMEIVNVKLGIPAGTTPDAYDFTSSALLDADIDGAPVVGDPVIDTLFVEEGPLLEVSIEDPVATGDTISYTYTVTNTSATLDASDIAFFHELTDIFPSPITGFTAPAMPVGSGSSVALVTFDTDRQAIVLSDGSLAAGAPPVMFTVEFDVPTGTPPGTFTSTSQEITATLDEGGPEERSVTGNTASDTFTVVAAPDFSMTFTDPVLRGDTTTLEFVIDTNLGETPIGDATDIAFTLDLGAALTDLTFDSVLLNELGGTFTGVGTDMLGYSGGSLTSGESGILRVEVSVPADAAPGSHTATTSDITATVEGLAVTGEPVADDLDIVVLTFEHEFIDPVIEGQETLLTYTFENLDPNFAADIVLFTHNLGDAGGVTPGLAKSGDPTTNDTGSSVSGTTSVTVSGGTVPAGSTAQITFPVLVPLGTDADDYASVTGNLFVTVNGESVTVAPSADVLNVVDAVSLTKTFLPDTVAPGDTTILEYTIINNLPNFSLSNIMFTEELDTVISGLDAVGTPKMENGFTIAGTDSLTISGSLGPGNMPSGTATFQVELQLPPAAAPGTFLFTTSDIEGDVDDPATTPFTVSPGPSASLAVTSNPDFGDAPNSYKTSLGVDGARHLAGGPRLGALRDFETNASIPLDGTGDDVTGSDDEDGVTIPTLRQGQTATITVVSSAQDAKLDAFIDFNDNGMFEPGEKVFDMKNLDLGSNDLMVPVPVDATITASTFARFRISTAGGLGSFGEAPDGEVEDYEVEIALPTIEFGEVGDVMVNQLSSPTTWTPVSFVRSYADPVVIAQPPSFAGAQPTTVRIRNVTSTGFELQLQEWLYLDGIHAVEKIGYAVMEAGTHILADGTMIAVGHASVNHVWKTTAFPTAFAGPPVVLTQGQTFIGSQPFVTRQGNTTTTNFRVRLQEEEGGDQVHALEDVGFIAFEPGTSTADGISFEAETTGNVFTDAWKSLGFLDSYGSPIFLAGMQTFDGPDTATLRYQNLTGTNVEVKVEEEQSADPETTHTTEKIGYAVFNGPGVLLKPDAPALLAAAGANVHSPSTEGLTAPELAATVDFALAALSELSLPNGQLARLEQTQLRIADLAGSRLAQVVGNTVMLDINAAGHSWFIDSTLGSNEGFRVRGSLGLADDDSPAANRIDLLSVVFHELGHVLGLDDDYTDAGSGDLMNGWLPTGTRRLPTAEDFDALFGDQAALEGALN